MLSCSQFLQEFTDYRDGLMDPAMRAEVEAHLAGCSSCATYANVVRRGVEELRAVPEIEPSEDFMTRLQFRLYTMEHESGARRMSRRSGASTAFIAGTALLIGAAAWVPVLTSGVPTVQLPPAVATAPRSETTVHALFRSGPILLPTQDASLLTSRTTPYLFARPALTRTSVYAADAAVPR